MNRDRVAGSAGTAAVLLAAVAVAIGAVEGGSTAQASNVPTCPTSGMRAIRLGGDHVVLNREGQRLAQDQPHAVGYVQDRDFCGPTPAANPGQAARMMRHRVNAQGEIWIPVFTRSGASRIGRVQTGQVR